MLITNTRELDTFLQKALDSGSAVAVDVETNGVKIQWGHHICGVSLAYKQDNKYHGCYIPTRHALQPSGFCIFEEEEAVNIHPVDLFFRLDKFFQDLQHPLVAHNAVFEHKAFSAEGICLDGIDCSMILCNVIDPSRPNALKKLMKIVFDRHPHEQDNLKMWIKANKDLVATSGFKYVPMEILAPYAEADAVECLRLLDVESLRLAVDTKKYGSKYIYKLERALVPVISRMESIGIHCSSEKLQELSLKVEEKLAEVRAWLFNLSGREFDPRSSEDIGNILYKELEVPVPQNVPSLTDTTALSLIDHEFAKAILVFRGLDKAAGTYLTGLQKHIHNGKIYTHYHQVKTTHREMGEEGDRTAGTETGRLASSDPNMTNISQDKSFTMRDGSKFKIPIRSCFLLPEDIRDKTQYILPDWSQIEMKLLAELANEKAMITAIENGMDLHSATAEKLFGKTVKDMDPYAYTGPEKDKITGTPISEEERKEWVWNKKFRSKSKVCNFSVVYGQGLKAFAAGMKTSMEEAKRFLEMYFSEFPEVKRFNEKNMRTVETMGGIRTFFGRLRVLKHSDSYKATNSLVQGSAADMLKISLVRVDKLLQPYESKAVINIHDEITVLHYKHETDVPRLVLAEMERWPEFSLKMSASMAVAWPSWGDKRDMTPEELRGYGIAT